MKEEKNYRACGNFDGNNRQIDKLTGISCLRSPSLKNGIEKPNNLLLIAKIMIAAGHKVAFISKRR